MEKKIFFLGGYDLEMVTIRELLVQYGQEYVDKHLSWGARLQDYISDLNKYGNNEEYRIYGIELDESGVEDIPRNYCAIDHHNDRENEASSLEQVCTLLGIEMDKYHRLVAANDSGYIPAMEKMGASKEEIDIIRRRDREAQGVTDDDEKKAEEAINNQEQINNLLFIKSETNRFSPIVDRLYPIKELLVYTEQGEFTYYGCRRDYLKQKIEAKFGALQELYFGGGPSGYLGFSGQRALCNRIVAYLKSKSTSGHVFLFPFSWETKGKKNCLEQLKKKENENWVRMRLPSIIEDEDLYNEMCFFYPFTHNTLYDKEGDSLNVWHFERKELQAEGASCEYVILLNDGMEYILDLSSININFYETGVGVLSFYMQNSRYYEAKDILIINQYGRRVFLPFKKAIGVQVPFSVEIRGLNGIYKHEFTEKQTQPNEPAGFIVDLVKESVSGIEKIDQVLDDRMFVMSWYKYKDLDFSNNDVFNSMMSYQGAGNDYLYQYVFIDHDGATCQNKEMRETLLKESIYTRWQEYGTLYGISRYSFVMLTTPGCPDFLLKYFETEYVRVAELALIQRASILRLSNLLRARDEKDFSEYYRQFINFISRFRFPEISAQDQGIELYDMLCRKMRIQENADYLDKQFNEREEFFELQNQGKLNRIAGWAVPVSIVSALFGFFFRDSLNATSVETWCWDSWSSYIPGIAAILMTVVLTVISAIYVRRRGK